MPAHLLILGAQQGVRWVLQNERMAVTSRRAGFLRDVAEGDTVFLYTTRGCFNNPTRDRGRVIGSGSVTGAVKPLDSPVALGERELVVGFPIRVEVLLPRGEGVVLSAHVSALSVFPDSRSWSTRMRRPVLTLPDTDAELIRGELRRIAGGETTPAESRASYV